MVLIRFSRPHPRATHTFTHDAQLFLFADDEARFADEKRRIDWGDTSLLGEPHPLERALPDMGTPLCRYARAARPAGPCLLCVSHGRAWEDRERSRLQ